MAFLVETPSSTIVLKFLKVAASPRNVGANWSKLSYHCTYEVYTEPSLEHPVGAQETTKGAQATAKPGTL